MYINCSILKSNLILANSKGISVDNEIKDVSETKNTENNYQTYDNGPTFFV